MVIRTNENCGNILHIIRCTAHQRLHRSHTVCDDGVIVTSALNLGGLPCTKQCGAILHIRRCTAHKTLHKSPMIYDAGVVGGYNRRPLPWTSRHRRPWRNVQWGYPHLSSTIVRGEGDPLEKSKISCRFGNRKSK